MSEIAKCPICGNKPGWHDFDIEARVFGGERSYFCCGMKAATAILWNRYAAAMELAKAVVKANEPYCIYESPIKPNYNQAVFGRYVTSEINNAEQRVLEVFK